MSVPTILHFIPSIGGGGAEAMLCNLTEAMDRSAWRTIVVTMNAQSWPAAAARLQSAGVELHDLAASAFLRPHVLKRLILLIRKLKPDIVQTWMHHADLVGGWCARLAGVRAIVWGIHCREVHRNPGDSDRKIAIFLKALVGSARRVPTRIISCSAAAIEDHAALGYPRSKMSWIPNGIRTDRFVPDAEARAQTRKELSISTDAPVVGFVGRFHEMKDLPVFFAAAADLQQRLPQAHFVLCGGSEEEMDEASRAGWDRMPAREQVRFVPFRPDPQRLYPALDVFALSSRTEACPMTVMEALACGVPCATTDVGDCARLIEGAGHTVPSGDARALALAWSDLLLQPLPLRQQMAAKARLQAEQKFGIAQAACAYGQLYREVLS